MDTVKVTRRDQCLFCNSRSCYEDVMTVDGSYHEIACDRHIKELHKHSDIMAHGVQKTFKSSTSKQRRAMI